MSSETPSLPVDVSRFSPGVGGSVLAPLAKTVNTFTGDEDNDKQSFYMFSDIVVAITVVEMFFSKDNVD